MSRLRVSSGIPQGDSPQELLRRRRAFVPEFGVTRESASPGVAVVALSDRQNQDLVSLLAIINSGGNLVGGFGRQHARSVQLENQRIRDQNETSRRADAIYRGMGHEESTLDAIEGVSLIERDEFPITSETTDDEIGTIVDALIEPAIREAPKAYAEQYRRTAEPILRRSATSKRDALLNKQRQELVVTYGNAAVAAETPEAIESAVTSAMESVPGFTQADADALILAPALTAAAAEGEEGRAKFDMVASAMGDRQLAFVKAQKRNLESVSRQHSELQRAQATKAFGDSIDVELTKPTAEINFETIQQRIDRASSNPLIDRGAIQAKQANADSALKAWSNNRIDQRFIELTKPGTELTVDEIRKEITELGSHKRLGDTWTRTQLDHLDNRLDEADREVRALETQSFKNEALQSIAVEVTDATFRGDVGVGFSLIDGVEVERTIDLPSGKKDVIRENISGKDIQNAVRDHALARIEAQYKPQGEIAVLAKQMDWLAAHNVTNVPQLTSRLDSLPSRINNSAKLGDQERQDIGLYMAMGRLNRTYRDRIVSDDAARFLRFVEVGSQNVTGMTIDKAVELARTTDLTIKVETPTFTTIARSISKSVRDLENPGFALGYIQQAAEWHKRFNGITEESAISAAEEDFNSRFRIHRNVASRTDTLNPGVLYHYEPLIEFMAEKLAQSAEGKSLELRGKDLTVVSQDGQVWHIYDKRNNQIVDEFPAMIATDWNVALRDFIVEGTSGIGSANQRANKNPFQLRPIAQFNVLDPNRRPGSYLIPPQ